MEEKDFDQIVLNYYRTIVSFHEYLKEKSNQITEKEIVEKIPKKISDINEFNFDLSGEQKKFIQELDYSIDNIISPVLKNEGDINYATMLILGLMTKLSNYCKNKNLI